MGLYIRTEVAKYVSDVFIISLDFELLGFGPSVTTPSPRGNATDVG